MKGNICINVASKDALFAVYFIFIKYAQLLYDKVLFRFGVVEDKRNTQRLFVILNPVNYKQHKSYIQHWTGPSFAITRVTPVGGTLSALAVSRCGKYVAIGSMGDGDVDIYIAFSLQVLFQGFIQAELYYLYEIKKN